MLELEVLKVISAVGDVSTVMLVFYVYVNGQKIRSFVHDQLKPINTAITKIETILEMKKGN